MINPLSGTSAQASGSPTQTKTAAAAELVDRFNSALATAPAVDPEVMRQFEDKLKEQVLNKIMRDSQKWTRRITGKD